jgi:hypothetical protein
MLRCMNQLVRQNSQFIIATHSPILLGRRFMNDHAGMLKELFSGNDEG